MVERGVGGQFGHDQLVDRQRGDALDKALGAIVEIGGSSDEVRVGTLVSLRYDGDDEDEVEQFLVGSIEEAGAGMDVISPTSALGEALLTVGAGWAGPGHVRRRGSN